MPRYRYQCNECDFVLYEFRDAKDRDYVKICGEVSGTPVPCRGQLVRQLSVISEPTVLDTVDRHRNVKHRKDQDKRVRQRAKDFFVKHEMDELIAQMGEEESKRLGWVKPDGKKNKGD